MATLSRTSHGRSWPEVSRGACLYTLAAGVFVRNRNGRLARVTDLTPPVIQAWMDDMAGTDWALSTMRVRQSTLSSFCAWLVKRDFL